MSLPNLDFTCFVNPRNALALRNLGVIIPTDTPEGFQPVYFELGRAEDMAKIGLYSTV